MKSIISLTITIFLLIFLNTNAGAQVKKKETQVSSKVLQSENWHQTFYYDDSFRVTSPKELVKSKTLAGVQYQISVNQIKYTVAVTELAKELFKGFTESDYLKGVHKTYTEVFGAEVIDFKQYPYSSEALYIYYNFEKKNREIAKRRLFVREQKDKYKLYHVEALITLNVNPKLNNTETIKNDLSKAEKFAESFSFGGDQNDMDYPPPPAPKPSGTISKSIYNNQRAKFSISLPNWSVLQNGNFKSVKESFVSPISVLPESEDNHWYLLGILDYPNSKSILAVKLFQDDFRDLNTLRQISNKARGKELKNTLFKTKIVKDVTEVDFGDNKGFMFETIQQNSDEKYSHFNYLIKIDDFNYVEFNWVISREEDREIIEKSMKSLSFTK